MNDYCESCKLKSHHPLSCLHNLNNLSNRLEKQLNAQTQEISTYLETSSSLSTVETPYDLFRNIEHTHAACDSCYQLPIRGTRYKCKKCPNFDLCFACRYSHPHDHSSFWPITTSKYHINQQCNICFGKIMDIVHRCLECSSNICNECYVINNHIHNKLISVKPYDCIIESSSNKPLNKLKKDDEVVIKFVLFNNSLQGIRGVTIKAENSPFEIIRTDFDVEISYGQIGVFDIAGIIRQQAGSFQTKFEFFDSYTAVQISNPITIKMTITEGIFSSLFRSSN